MDVYLKTENSKARLCFMYSEIVWNRNSIAGGRGGGHTERWHHVWDKRLPVTGERASWNKADVIISPTCAPLINRSSYDNVRAVAVRQWDTQRRVSPAITGRLWCLHILNTSIMNFKGLNFTWVWRNAHFHIAASFRADVLHSEVRPFIPEQINDRENGQRNAAAVNYLRQLLFHNAFVLQCDWLLFGALCCQHLSCRAEHITGKDRPV